MPDGFFPLLVDFTFAPTDDLDFRLGFAFALAIVFAFDWFFDAARCPGVFAKTVCRDFERLAARGLFPIND